MFWGGVFFAAAMGDVEVVDALNASLLIHLTLLGDCAIERNQLGCSWHSKNTGD